MCGIAGYFVTKDSPKAEILQRLCHHLMEGIQTRGRDATGYAFVSGVDKHVKLAKAPVNATTFLSLPGHLLSKDREVKSMPQSMILHARAATKGDPINNWNNHPVYSKSSGLCLIHNGWLVNDDELVEEYKLHPDAQVDTEAYLRLVEKFYIDGGQKSMEQAIANATEVSYGAIACAMIQGGRKGVMWLWKDDGPIALAKVDWGWVFASTTDILVKAIVAMQAKCAAADTSFFKVAELGKGTILRFAQGETVKKFELNSVEWDKLPPRLTNRVSRIIINGVPTVRRIRPSTGSTTVYNSTFPGQLSEYDNYEEWWATANGRRDFVYDSRDGYDNSLPYQRSRRRRDWNNNSQSTHGYGSTFLPDLSRPRTVTPDGNSEGSTNSGVSQTPSAKEGEGEKGPFDSHLWEHYD